MKLYFSKCGERRLIREVETGREASREITQFLKDHHFTSYYTRIWRDESNEDELVFDVGSYTEFFILKKEEKWPENWLEILNG